MSLRLYNTLTRRKEDFVPLDPGHVRMYVCGPTVYDRAHIGNARPVVVFDVLYRLLRARFPRVTYVRNITDVDDKIINAARERSIPIDRLTEETTAAFHEDMAALGALPPDVEPRATRHIPQMIAMIEKLIAAGNAYVCDGHVLFNVPSMPDYGLLSRRSLREMIAGARVEVAPYKKDPADFVLWKPSADDQPGWASPWGRGRPGWHIECSAMSEAHLGESFDIHGGGLDLIFPHHENEIAQSTCAHGGAMFVRYWLHNGYLTVNGEKMSKSLGNFFTVRDLLDEGCDGETLRLVLLSTHYRAPLDFTKDKLAEAKARLDRWYRARDAAAEKLGLDDAEVKAVAKDTGSSPADVMDALGDDLNTALALTRVDHLANTLFQLLAGEGDESELRAGFAALQTGGGMLGLLEKPLGAWFKKGVSVSVPAGRVEITGYAPSVTVQIGEAEIKKLIAKRADARRAKDFAEADRIRETLAADGVILEDRPDGTTDWRRE